MTVFVTKRTAVAALQGDDDLYVELRRRLEAGPEELTVEAVGALARQVADDQLERLRASRDAYAAEAQRLAEQTDAVLRFCEAAADALRAGRFVEGTDVEQ